jgi:hypothetical protein
MYKSILLFFWLGLPSLVSAATYPWTAKSPIADLTYCSKFQEAFVSELGSASTDLFYPLGNDDFNIPPGTAMITPFLVPPGVKSMSIDTSIIVMGYLTTSIIGDYPSDLLCDDENCTGFSIRDPANNFKSGGNRLTATLFFEPKSLSYAREGYFIVFTDPRNPANFQIGPYNISMAFDKQVDNDGDGILDEKQGDVLFREWRDQGCPISAVPPVISNPTTTPVTETPVTETPVTETPVTETPVTETPVTETPVTETPVTETPVTTTPPDNTATDPVPVVDTNTALQVQYDALLSKYEALVDKLPSLHVITTTATTGTNPEMFLLNIPTLTFSPDDDVEPAGCYAADLIGTEDLTFRLKPADPDNNYINPTVATCPE